MFVLSHQAIGQEGYSTSSIHMNRNNGITQPDQVVVEEYVNYHKHNIELPTYGQEVALSMDHLYLKPEEIVLQVGLSTSQLLDYSDMTPVNVSLVIDKSGSMQAEDRLGKVKRALYKFIKGLRPTDYVSIIAYDSYAQVVLPAQEVGYLSNLQEVISSISPGGSTNLHEGLMMGYREVQKNFAFGHNNKVVLLTDGIANAGITDPLRIVGQSGAQNDVGIDVSTIGVGNDLNHELLKQISDRGRGANHFIGSHEEDIQKVFEEELESLLSPVGRNAYLDLELGEYLEVDHIYGYSPEWIGKKVRIPLKNLNNGLTQVIICKLVDNSYLPQSFEGARPVKATLSYDSHGKRQKVKVVAEQNLPVRHTSNKEVIKNYSIAQMAEALKEMAIQAEKREYLQAARTIQYALDEVNQRFPYLKDDDILRVKSILEKEMEGLRVYTSVSGY